MSCILKSFNCVTSKTNEIKRLVAKIKPIPSPLILKLKKNQLSLDDQQHNYIFNQRSVR